MDFSYPKKLTDIKHGNEDEISSLLDNVPQIDSLFTLIKRIGQGTFSSVYLGCSKHGINNIERNYFAVKHIIPTSHPSRVYMELKCLKTMGGMDNIIKATTCLRHMNHIVLVMPYIAHDNFMDYVGHLTTDELREYLLKLFIALKRVHSFNIIHRDIKPSNFLYNRKQRRFALIDFGLAQEYVASASYSSHGKQKKMSPPLLETPHLGLCRPVKRKLSVSRFSSPDIDQLRKNSSVGFLAANTLKSSVLSPSTGINNCNILRRSPRKLAAISARKNHTKENTPLTPTRPTIAKLNKQPNDSPSKHTRLAESFIAGKWSSGYFEAKRGVSTLCENVTPVSQGQSNPLFRSSAKSLNSRPNNAFIKGLNDSLQDRSSRNNTPASSCKSGRENFGLTASLSGYSLSGTSSTLQKAKTNSGQSVLLSSSSCNCYGSAKVCSVCLQRKNQHAPRAGTPGFRAPEVLLRHPNQNTALDMWSAGVILLCLLSGRYPFFRAVDDFSSLAEITTILGTKNMKKASANLNKLFTSSEDLPQLDLRKICEKLRNKQVVYNENNLQNGEQAKDLEFCKGCKQNTLGCVCLEDRLSTSSNLFTESTQNCTIKVETNQNETESGYPTLVYELLQKLLDPNPDTRITAEGAINHPFLAQYSDKMMS